MVQWGHWSDSSEEDKYGYEDSARWEIHNYMVENEKLKETIQDLNHKIDYLSKRNLDIHIFFDTLEELISEADETYHYVQGSKEEEKELGKDYDKVLSNLEGKWEMASDIETAYKDLQNVGYIDDMLESHKYIDEGGVLLNSNYHEVRDLHHEIIIVPVEIRRDYEVVTDGL
jgi:predicted RNase H-like nuclease (RuvC/YqgF family)